MVAYSFKARFVDAIAAGAKRQTIRADRKRHARPGEELQLYTAMRTKQCRLIRRATCVDVAPIRLDFVERKITCAGAIFAGRLRDSFARADGFADWPDMVAFWKSEHESIDAFSGVLITWET